MSLQLIKYHKYKPSGIIWIGDIPEHWEVIKLKYALDSLESGSRETGGGSIAEGVFSIGGEHIGWFGELLLGNPKYISEEYFGNLKKGKIKANDVLLVKDGATIGKCSLVRSLPFDECAVNEHVFILRNNNRFNSIFIFYFMWCYVGQEQIFINIKGSAQPGLNSNFQNEFFITVPPLTEQTAIANFLDDKTAKIDLLIEKKKKLIELYKEERTAVINQAVTKGLNLDSPDLPDELDHKNQGNPLSKVNQIADKKKMKNSGIEWLGQIPEHWEVKKLKYVAKLEYGESLTADDRMDGEVPVFGSNGIVGFHSIAISKSPCIIIGRKGSFGKINWSDIPCFPIDTTYYIDNDKCKENLRFIYFVLLTLKLDSISKDTGVPGLNRDDAYEKVILIPPLEEQLQIVEYIEAETKRIDEKIARTEKEIKLLQEYRTALISEVVTGKIKV